MAAGMHAVRDLARIGQPRLLLHRQGVHVRTNQQGRTGPLAADVPDDTGATDAGLVLDPEARQGLRDEGSRPDLLEGDFGIFVDAPSDIDEARLVFIDDSRKQRRQVIDAGMGKLLGHG
ncbi:hypothetical protein Q1M64_00805 (plasmid) [Sinorhizobium meliloti]|nr:hypothetical protein Q1M63_08015 [Sinorhizobium meliloti]WKL39689.1 hypothetical protein Q1M64_00805 [Sinorhizobium meliloti]